ncbi:DASH complex subunit DAD4 [Striga asiatica]|uniref:DASH complex subunit DAD4 n=1 Tax=Striga asiatica TaxID=4170 RepID=A0A5A7QPT6_STRAF|nr:DASH complex subunit DAD4 [Striga asiatica]
MGNCQAIDGASLVIQHPNGKVDRMFGPIAANEVMKLNPGHYVALLLTTTLYSSAAGAAAGATATTKNNANGVNNDKNAPLRVTRIKLLRPTDTLALGHVYRLVTSQDVMKGLMAKKQKMNEKMATEKINSELEAVNRKNHDLEKKKQVKHERHRSRSNTPVIKSTAMIKSRAWQPSLRSISESGS